MTHSIWMPRLLAFALCSLGVVGCSDDDPSTGIDPLQGQGGSAGSSGGDGGSAGSAGASGAGQGGTSGGSAGSGTGGSAMPAGGSAGSAGSAGAAGSAGSGGNDEPDAGGGEPEPDAGDPNDPDPQDETVEFSDVFPVLVAECGNCHGAGAPRPQFAQEGNEDASFAATELNSTGQGQGQVVSGRIIARAVTQRTMPPGCNGGAFGTATCIDEDDADLLQEWLNDGALP